MLKLSPAVFYQSRKDVVVCYQTREHTVMTFNAVVGDILDGIKKTGSRDGVVSYLKSMYKADTLPDDLDAVVDSFIGQLKQLKIVYDSSLRENRASLENIVASDLNAREFSSALIELTYRCSEKCRHCYVIQGDDGELTTGEVFKLLDDLKKAGVFYLTFTGGECFLRKDIVDILSYAYNLGFVYDIFTNGISISDSQIIDVVRLCPRAVHFSIYSAIPEKHDAITQVPGSFYRTVETLKKFKALGVSVNIKSLGLEETYEGIPKLLDLAEELGATIQIGFSISPRNDDDMAPTTMRIKDIENLERAVLSSHDNIDIETPVKGSRDVDYAICGAGMNSLSINPFGTVFPCNALNLPLGNIRERSIVDIWNRSPELKKWRENTFDMIEDCRGCDKKDYCGFCPGTALSETGSPFKKYDEACRIAEIRKKNQI